VVDRTPGPSYSRPVSPRSSNLLFGALLLAGCGGAETGTPTVPVPTGDPLVPVDGDTLVVAVPYDPARLDGATPSLALAAAIVEQI